MSIKEVAKILRLPLPRIEQLISSGSLAAKASEAGACDIPEASLMQFINTYGPSDSCWDE